MEKNERCHHIISSVPIIQGNKVIGINHFCTRPNCNYEYDEKMSSRRNYYEYQGGGHR